jgi:hypothetical protein
VAVPDLCSSGHRGFDWNGHIDYVSDSSIATLQRALNVFFCRSAYSLSIDLV